eukprot:7382113-Prymnesium_polylepis.1
MARAPQQQRAAPPTDAHSRRRSTRHTHTHRAACTHRATGHVHTLWRAHMHTCTHTVPRAHTVRVPRTVCLAQSHITVSRTALSPAACARRCGRACVQLSVRLAGVYDVAVWVDGERLRQGGVVEVVPNASCAATAQVGGEGSLHAVAGELASCVIRTYDRRESTRATGLQPARKAQPVSNPRARHSRCPTRAQGAA